MLGSEICDFKLAPCSSSCKTYNEKDDYTCSHDDFIFFSCCNEEKSYYDVIKNQTKWTHVINTQALPTLPKSQKHKTTIITQLQEPRSTSFDSPHSAQGFIEHSPKNQNETRNNSAYDNNSGGNYHHIVSCRHH